MTIALITFGFKFGVPFDVDLLFDLRFLKNPFFVSDLKSLTGEDPRVQEFVFSDPEAGEFCGHLDHLLGYLLPLFERERRSYLNIGIGCTGGRHRSVVIARRLQEMLQKSGYRVVMSHRDLAKS